MSRLLVTGSEGFLGKFAVRELQNLGHTIFTLDLKSSEASDSHIQGDIRSINFEELFSRIKVDTVLHLAAQVDVRKSFLDPQYDLEVNGLGTLRLVTSAIRGGISHFCYIHSGGAVYDSDAPIPLDEKSPEKPVSPYGLSKRLGEAYVALLCSTAGIQWSSLAYSNVFGPAKKHGRGVIFELSSAIVEGKTPRIFGKEVTRDFLYVSDAVNAMVKAIEKPTNSRVNISSGTEISLSQLYSKIANFLEIYVEPEIFDANPGEILRSCLSNKRAKELIDWTPQISFDQGLRMSLEEFGNK